MLGCQFNGLAIYLGLISTLCRCDNAKAKPSSIQIEGLPKIPLPHSTKILDPVAPPSDERTTNYNLNFLVNYNFTSPIINGKQDFNKDEKTGQKFRSASNDIKWSRYAFVTDRALTKGNDRRLESHGRGNIKDNKQTKSALYYGLYRRLSNEQLNHLKGKRNDSVFDNEISKGHATTRLDNYRAFEKRPVQLYARIADPKQDNQETKSSLFNDIRNADYNQASLVNTDIKYQEESTEFVSRFIAEPTDYMHSSQRNGFVPVSGPFGNSGYYRQSRNYHHGPQTTVDYPPTGHASQPRAETLPYYSSGRDILGSGNFEILRGGTFSDNDELVYPHQQNNDMLFERDVSYTNPILGFQGFNHFSSPLHSSLSKLIHVAAAPPPLINAGHASHFVATSAILEAVP